jgi:hypothetical protein
MNHLESLVREYLEWRGYLVRSNEKVNALRHGGYEMELDIVGYEPHEKTVVHYEPSIDGYSWEKREKRFQRKFELGRKYIPTEVFPWLPPDVHIHQIAICVVRGKRKTVGGATLLTVDEFVAEVRQAVIDEGPADSNAISETYPMLRTIQFACVGYKALKKR